MASGTAVNVHGAECLKKPNQNKGAFTSTDKLVILCAFPLLVLQVVWSTWLLGEDPRRHAGGQHDAFFLAKPSTYLLLHTGAKMPALGLGTLPAWYLPDYKPELVSQAVRTALVQGRFHDLQSFLNIVSFSETDRVPAHRRRMDSRKRGGGWVGHRRKHRQWGRRAAGPLCHVQALEHFPRPGNCCSLHFWPPPPRNPRQLG
jgi:hypothetical protein